MTMVLSLGSLKASTGLAALRAIAMNSRLPQEPQAATRPSARS